MNNILERNNCFDGLISKLKIVRERNCDPENRQVNRNPNLQKQKNKKTDHPRFVGQKQTVSYKCNWSFRNGGKNRTKNIDKTWPSNFLKLMNKINLQIQGQ